MKTLREWVEEQRQNYPQEYRVHGICCQEGCDEGWEMAMEHVLAELKSREEAERERVNENVNALDDLAGHVLEEKEGGAG